MELLPNLPLLLLLLLHSPSNAADHPPKATCMFDAIYQLGDSISDTGNLIRENPATPFSRFPYGESFFNNPTGRCSNGLLIIDQFAIAAGLPLINPYLDKDAPMTHGVNFAVAGSTPLPSEVLAQKRISSRVTNSSLSKQLDWMSTHFNITCLFKENDCTKKLKNALFFVGEIGGNDYNYALFQGKTIEEVRNMVPEVVQIIKEAVERVINYGAFQVIVPGNFPIGCLPIFLAGFQTDDATAYDELHCLKDLNNLAIYHNTHLNDAIKSFRKENPNVNIVYGDYYNALLWVLREASSLGFDETSLHKPCCGMDGDYEFNLMQMCGAPGVPVCGNPGERISWDGFHLTQNAYRLVTYWLILNILPRLYCIP
ncbi:acetylajmalan esterase-like [Cucurbita moschata]|uniref:Acetylajmalan esterase-like n=1 Tax=Cucurbita moschata TaxID=3662 RepID=A0A6J1GKN7_CUCMO|nr:acetylajmalan esterase-like [Cucurbita moschata]